MIGCYNSSLHFSNQNRVVNKSKENHITFLSIFLAHEARFDFSFCIRKNVTTNSSAIHLQKLTTLPLWFAETKLWPLQSQLRGE